jgi:predicted transcriptional regulator
MPDTVVAPPSPPFIGNTTTIVTSYVSNNKVSGEALPKMIQAIHDTLKKLIEGEETVKPPKPAVDPKRSVFSDYLICLEDGRRLASLKRHLMHAYQMTPADYRKKWDLPGSYPMVAPNYSKTRRQLALDMGLGQRKSEVEVSTTKSRHEKRS